MNTPVMDERPSVLGFLPISDFEDTDQPSLPEMFVATSEMRILDRLNNLETIIREQHLKTRDHDPMGSCRARSVYLTTRLLGRLL